MIEILNIPLWVAAYFWRKKNELHFTDIVLIFFSYPWLYKNHETNDKLLFMTLHGSLFMNAILIYYIPIK
jgi:hypothetical protein